MGAFDTFDTFAPPVRCPACGALHEHALLSKFFAPKIGQWGWDFNGHRFTTGVTYPIAIDLDALRDDRVWEDEWLPLARWTGGPLALLDDECTACACGAVVWPIYSFRIDDGSPITATLVDALGWTVIDPAPLAAAHFVNDVALGEYDWEVAAQRRAELRALPREARFAAVHRNLLIAATGKASEHRKLSLYIDECLWCATSWRAWIVREVDGDVTLVADLGGWCTLRGTLDELLTSIPDERDFAEAVAHFRR